MALWVCGGEVGCGTKYAVGLFRCPRCHNTEFFEDGDPMAKISRYGGASDKTLSVPESAPEVASPADVMAAAGAEVPAGLVDGLPQPAAEEPLDVTEYLAGTPVSVEEGGEESSPGSSSSASTETPQPNSEPSRPPTLSPAPTTGSRSRKGRTGSRSASSTDGGQETGTSSDGE